MSFDAVEKHYIGLCGHRVSPHLASPTRVLRPRSGVDQIRTVDQGALPLAVGIDGDRRVCRTGRWENQLLAPQAPAAEQEDIAGSKLEGIDFCEGAPGRIRSGSRVGIVALEGIHIVSCGMRFGADDQQNKQEAGCSRVLGCVSFVGRASQETTGKDVRVILAQNAASRR